MLAASLDILEKAQVPPLQARAIVQAIELELVAQHDVLATKQDLALFATKQDLALFKQDFRHDLQEMRHALELKIEQVRSELIRWVFTVMLGQTAAVLGIVYFMVDHFKK